MKQGYAIVARDAEIGYFAITDPKRIAGERIEEIWIFGQPDGLLDMELQQFVYRLIRQLHVVKIRKINQLKQL
jgi:hypothetical protein